MEHIETIEKQREFKKFLEHSPRIVFSAKFGDGKTQFLNEIKENREFMDYQFFTIYPVNYVVAENADIFEYVKRDILLQMAKMKLLNEIDLDALISSFASFENFREILSFLVSFLPAGDFINKLIDKGLEIKDKYQEQKATLDKYEATFKAQRGGLYEEDAYTQLIQEGLNYLRESTNVEGGNKKSVLIIEDLDRLDPGHLFRILNVISAHIDAYAYKNNAAENKFGFDNIVIVMDYDTTRYIFEHFYGKKASYNGYMSKFMSVEPFRYSLKDLAMPELINKLEKLIGARVVKMWYGVIAERVEEFSIRDISRLCAFDYRSRILKPYVTISGLKYSTDLPIFRLLICLSEMGVHLNEILNFGKKPFEGRIQDMIELFYPVYHAANKMSDIYFDMGPDNETGENTVYGCVLSEKDGVVVNISCAQAMAWGNGLKMFDEEKLDEDLIEAIPKFEEGISLASLNRSLVQINS